MNDAPSKIDLIGIEPYVDQAWETIALAADCKDTPMTIAIEGAWGVGKTTFINLIEENARAIWKSIEALRGLERWGAKSFVDAAFRCFEALPAPGVTHWRHVLGSAVMTLDDAEARYRKLARERHPDRPTGSEAAMADLNVAIGMAREELSP